MLNTGVAFFAFFAFLRLAAPGNADDVLRPTKCGRGGTLAERALYTKLSPSFIRPAYVPVLLPADLGRAVHCEAPSKGAAAGVVASLPIFTSAIGLRFYLREQGSGQLGRTQPRAAGGRAQPTLTARPKSHR